VTKRTPELRVAARAVVLDPENRILLVLFRSPDTGGTWWATPGGALDPGESHEDALRRELREEAGIVPGELGPCVWEREHVFEWGGRLVRQVERCFLVRVDSSEPAPQFSREQLEAEGLHDARWWTLAELEGSDAVSAPRRLPALLRDLLEAGPPEKPIDAGV
jgi:8-oxo-dGTP pyrophosphatase MutT (NUDIX family)